MKLGVYGSLRHLLLRFRWMNYSGGASWNCVLDADRSPQNLYEAAISEVEDYNPGTSERKRNVSAVG